MSAPDGPVTLLLTELREGNQDATNRLMPLIYNELRRMAGSYMQRERPGHTLQATALVNEVYMRLAGGATVPWQSRAHFFGIAAPSAAFVTASCPFARGDERGRAAAAAIRSAAGPGAGTQRSALGR